MNHFYFLIICLIGSLKGKNAYDSLLERGLNNSLQIAEILGMRYISENNKTYYAKEDMPDQALIMKIPSSLILNLDKALELLNNKKLNKLYSEYQKTEFKISLSFLPANSEQSFLSYLMYLVTHHKKQYKKTKFYKYFRHLFNTFETNLDYYPIFYNKQQLKLIQGSISYTNILFMREQFKEEYNQLEHLYKQQNLYSDEYINFRVLTLAKSINLRNVSSIIPFVDMFVSDPIDYNVNLFFNETTKEVYVYTTKEIKKEDILKMKTEKMSNIKNFYIYGQTFEKMNDYIDNYKLPMVANEMIQDLDNKKQIKYYKKNIDLNKKDFYKDALETYKSLSIDKKEDGSDLSAYNLFLKYLEEKRERFNPITRNEIDKAFYNYKDIRNVVRILDLEKNFLDKKLDELRKFIEKLKKKIKKSENKINKDL